VIFETLTVQTVAAVATRETSSPQRTSRHLTLQLCANTVEALGKGMLTEITQAARYPLIEMPGRASDHQVSLLKVNSQSLLLIASPCHPPTLSSSVPSTLCIPADLTPDGQKYWAILASIAVGQRIRLVAASGKVSRASTGKSITQ